MTYPSNFENLCINLHAVSVRDRLIGRDDPAQVKIGSILFSEKSANLSLILSFVLKITSNFILGRRFRVFLNAQKDLQLLTILDKGCVTLHFLKFPSGKQ